MNFIAKIKILGILVFAHLKYGYFPLIYKSVVRSMKFQAIQLFFWILFNMIYIHHCTKQQLAWFNSVRNRTL